MKVTFEIKDDRHSRSVEIKDSTSITLGRESKSNDVVVHSSTVSRTHATIKLQQNPDGSKQWVYTDHSRHGSTIVNGANDKGVLVTNNSVVLDRNFVLELGPKATVTVKIFEEVHYMHIHIQIVDSLNEYLYAIFVIQASSPKASSPKVAGLTLSPTGAANRKFAFAEVYNAYYTYYIHIYVYIYIL